MIDAKREQCYGVLMSKKTRGLVWADAIHLTTWLVRLLIMEIKRTGRGVVALSRRILERTTDRVALWLGGHSREACELRGDSHASIDDD